MLITINIINNVYSAYSYMILNNPGDFNCSRCQITSLEGCPRRLESGSFYCEQTNITTLEGGPEYWT